MIKITHTAGSTNVWEKIFPITAIKSYSTYFFAGELVDLEIMLTKEFDNTKYTLKGEEAKKLLEILKAKIEIKHEFTEK